MDSLDSGLSIAELKFELPVVTTTAFTHYRGIEEEHVETIITRNTGTQETRETRTTRSQNKITAMATLLKYKKGLKRPTLAWNEMSFVTVR